MLFHEIYGSYYRAVGNLITEAIEGTLTQDRFFTIIRNNCFGESNSAINMKALGSTRWKLIEEGKKQKKYSTLIKHIPDTPVSLIEKQWMKALLQDPRIKLFDLPLTGLDDIEPLYDPDTFIYFDQYADGDNYKDENYILLFRTILQAIKEKREISIRYAGRNKNILQGTYIPYRLEYSAKDDKFRLITFSGEYLSEINLARIISTSLGEPYPDKQKKEFPVYRNKAIVMELTDDRNALERVMLHFADLEKETVKMDERHYRITIRFAENDEIEILIRVLSFGPVLRVIEPEEFISKIRERLNRQKQYH